MTAENTMKEECEQRSDFKKKEKKWFNDNQNKKRQLNYEDTNK